MKAPCLKCKQSDRVIGVMTATIERLTSRNEEFAQLESNLVAVVNTLTAENAALKGFSYGILKDHPDNDIDGGIVQDLGLKHGLIVAHQVTEPCGEGCNCIEYYGIDPEGKFCEVENCYRLVDFVKETK